MGLIIEKTFAILAILVETLFFAVFPLLNKKFRNSPKIMGFANAFSGGLFLSAGLFHILPDANEDYSKAMEKEGKKEGYFPWPNLCCILSFAFVFLFDKVLNDSHHLLHAGHDHDHGHDHGHSHGHEHNHDHNDHAHKHGHNNQDHDNISHNSLSNSEINIKSRDLVTKNINKKLIETPATIEEFDMNNNLQPYILVMAMAIHGFFEGLALGVFNDKG
jgi:solute carrier family 39 (zinc transporter), member 1/2/3